MDRKNNNAANKNNQSKYDKLYFIEHSSGVFIDLSLLPEFPYKSFIFTAILNYAIWNSHTEFGPPVGCGGNFYRAQTLPPLPRMCSWHITWSFKETPRNGMNLWRLLLAGVDDHVSFLLAVQFYFFPCYLMKISRFKPFKSGINLSGLMKWLGWSQDHTSEHPSGSLKIVCFVKARGLLLASAWDYKVQWRSDHFLQRKGKSKKVWSRIFCLQHESQKYDDWLCRNPSICSELWNILELWRTNSRILLRQLSVDYFTKCKASVTTFC